MRALLLNTGLFFAVSALAIEQGPQPFIDRDPATSAASAYLRARQAFPAAEFSEALDHEIISRFLAAIRPGPHPWRFSRCSNQAREIIWSHDGTKLAVRSKDEVTILSDTAHPLERIASPNALPPTAVTWHHPSGRPLVAFGHELYLCRAPQDLKRRAHFPTEIQYVSIRGSCSDQVAVGTDVGSVFVYDTKAETARRLITSPAGSSVKMSALAWHGQKLAMGGSDGNWWVVDASQDYALVAQGGGLSSRIFGTVYPCHQHLYQMAWNHDGTQLAASTDGETEVHIWQPGQQITDVTLALAARDSLVGLAWHPSRNKLAIGHEYSRVLIADRDDSSKYLSLGEDIRSRVTAPSVAWHPDGYILASGTQHTVNLWIDYKSLFEDFFAGKMGSKPTPEQTGIIAFLIKSKHDKNPLYAKKIEETAENIKKIRNSLPILIQRALAQILDIRK